MKKFTTMLLTSALVLGIMGGTASAAEVRPQSDTIQEQVESSFVQTRNVLLRQGQSTILSGSTRYKVANGHNNVSLGGFGLLKGLKSGNATVYGYNRSGKLNFIFYIRVL
ncbi:hypothetical protein [Paenibacillus sp. 481]|uniref:hypothetical protein n=1 Tax=Paenibacillus sp. 481 TaxID=2835869 RepID=UPI001E3492D3|nr:hypothetical protein [Paenibacillus sp. 481]UHA73131.1 hypothetical protein KIK04_21450 [Paenibacillus sp. 481]